VADTRLIHQTAFDTSKEVVKVFSPLLRDEELADAFNEVYQRAALCAISSDPERENPGENGGRSQ
jgi:hypothetical protein